MDDLEAYVSGLSGKMDGLKAEINQAKTRSKAIQDLLNFFQMYADMKPIYDQMNGIKFKSRREKFKAEYDNELRRFYLARRKLMDHFSEDGKLPINEWRRELVELEQTVKRISADQTPLWAEWKKLIGIEASVRNTLREMEHMPRKQQEQER